MLSFFLMLCDMNKQKETVKYAPSGNTPYAKAADSSITVAQMQKWLQCNPRLDSLSYLYLDSFKTEDKELRMHYQQKFIEAQNKICVQQGLIGGYNEYVWILRNSGKRQNKKVLDSLNLATY